jgi:hypothetical protein
MCKFSRHFCVQVAYDRDGDSLALERRSLCLFNMFRGGGATVCVITCDLAIFVDEVRRTTMLSIVRDFLVVALVPFLAICFES